ncbi:hypothetical protein FNH22_00515 [Fulvivirga sp. M361]|uniref:PKD domain-containing protein n=1 Tax=Fulvivirga sp. M361 TaxID=2594266 RepID=UPI001179CDC4|nr:hypothetical protein [Fulvivirga sp. M361]TRX62611.1 hypothetical protein FNH22_00515 [Fulvivirga sp. M361]
MKWPFKKTSLVVVFLLFVNLALKGQNHLTNEGYLTVVRGTVLSINGNYHQQTSDLIAIDTEATINLNGNLINEGNGSLTDGLAGTLQFHGDSISTPASTIILRNFESDLQSVDDSLRVTGNLEITDRLTFSNGHVAMKNDSLFLTYRVDINSFGALDNEAENRRFLVSGTSGLAQSGNGPFYSSSEIINPINKGNLGLTVTMAAGSGGEIVVNRYHNFSTALPNNNIDRVFALSTTNEPRGGTVNFQYFDTELGVHSGNEPVLRLFHSADNGMTWNVVEGTLNTTLNEFTSENISDVSGLWTLGTCNYPEVMITSSDISCRNTIINVTSNVSSPGNFSYQWYRSGALLPGETNADLDMEVTDQAIDLMLEVMNEYGCVTRTPFNIALRALPPMDLGEDLLKCVEDRVTLDAGIDYPAYLWLNEAEEVVSTERTLQADIGTYTLIIQDEFGCENSDEVAVSNYVQPVSDLPDETRFCGTSVILGANLEGLNAGATFRWTNLAGDVIGSAATLTVMEDGMYTVSITNEFGCQVYSSTQVTLNTTDFANLGTDISVACRSVGLDAGFPGSTYVWSDGSRNQTLVTKESGEFWVEITDINGCIDRDTVNVEILPALDSAFFLSATEAFVNDTIYFIGLTSAPTTSVTWDFDDGTVKNDTLFPLHQYASVGEYVPMLTTIFGNGCVDSYNKRVVITEEKESEGGRVAKQAQVFKSVKIYPNPNDGRFSVEVELNEPMPLEIELVQSAAGRTIDSRSSEASADHFMRFDYSYLNAGVYHFILEAAHERKAYRLAFMR